MATVMSCGTGNWTGPLPGDPDNNSILSAVPTFGGIDVSWTYPNINPHAVAHVLLYRGISSNYAASVKQATVSGNTFYDKITGTAGTRYYYWIQIVSVNGTVGAAIGPASAIARSRIEDTIIDLSGKIEESSLGTALRGSIGDITANYNELVGRIGEFSGNNQAFMDALTGVQSGLTGALTLLNTEVTQRTSGQNALLSQQNVLAALNQVNVAAILEEKTVRVSADSALAQTVRDLGVANTAGIAAAVKTLESSKIGYSGKATTEEPYEGNGSFEIYPVSKYPALDFPDYALNRFRIIDKQGVTNWNAGNVLQLKWVVGLPLAQAIKSVGISDGTETLTVEQRATAQKLTNGTLLGKYTVKIDQGGRVAGFGLASSSNQKDGTTSAFAVNADTFSISRPLSFSQPTAPSATAKGQTWFNETDQKVYKATALGTSSWVLNTAKYPFIVDTVSGEVFIDDAVINKLTFDKLRSADGSVIVENGKLKATYIETSGLLVKDALGKVSFGSGDALKAVDITGLGSLAKESGVGIGTNVYIPTPTGASILKTTDFVNYLSKINDTNIGTFMSSAAIGNAYIGNAAIETLNIKGNAVIVPSVDIRPGSISGRGLGTFRFLGETSITLDQAGWIYAIFTAKQSYTAGSRISFATIYIVGVGTQVGGAAVTTNIAVSYARYMPAGTHDISVTWEGEDSTISVQDTTLLVMGVKR